MSEISQQDAKAVEDAASSLSQHFDSVRIFVTRFDGSDTLCMGVGKGNIYAQYGQVREWMVRFDEQSRMDQKRE